MTTSFQQMKALEAERALDQQIHSHRTKQFDFGSITSSEARHILRKGIEALRGNGDIRITAASTIGGMTVSQCDEILDAYFAQQPYKAGATSTRMGVKMALVNAGILLRVRGA